jgi:integrase
VRGDLASHRARADLPGAKLKDLRDTFASQLLTAGVNLAYVSGQLGHADVSVTARHYARFIGTGGDDFVYVEPA